MGASIYIHARRSAALGAVVAAGLALSSPGPARAEEGYTRSEDLQAFAERELERSAGSGRWLGLRLSRMGFTYGIIETADQILCARVLCGNGWIRRSISHWIEIQHDAIEAASAVNYSYLCPNPETRKKVQSEMVFRAPRIKPLQE